MNNFLDLFDLLLLFLFQMPTIASVFILLVY